MRIIVNKLNRIRMEALLILDDKLTIRFNEYAYYSVNHFELGI